LAEQGAVNVDEKFAAARESLRAFDRIAPKDPPDGFIGTLRPYQMLAQGWFEFLRTLGFGGCLADDMGLGKTIQVLALLEHRRQLNSGPSLIVVPRSLVFNWTAEARKFAPKIRVLDQSHSQRQKGTDHLTDFDLVLTTYGTLRRDAAFLKDFEFDYVVLDEAQAIKNATTEAAKAVRLLNGKHRLALSGTPIENHLGELWSLFDFLNPGMLGRIGRFSSLAQDADADQRTLLAAAVRPFILRRTKRQVAPELPERIEQTIIVELDADQRKSYDELREYYRKMLLNKIDTDGIGKSQMVILEALLRLRQAACHPGLIDKARANEPSAKLEELLTRLVSATESNERVLVFSQFTSLLAILKTRLKQAKIDFLYLDGKTRDRQSLVDQFQSGTGPSVFLISLKAGGVGLNLTAARTVYLLDPWWNPAVEAQAIDRTHRIGQQQTVFATRLITADTVEQKVLELQAKKKGLADAIVNADNAGISSLTREDLELLLA
jgi:SNF2 family DNA or RNA helicase